MPKSCPGRAGIPRAANQSAVEVRFRHAPACSLQEYIRMAIACLICWTSPCKQYTNSYEELHMFWCTFGVLVGGSKAHP